MSARLQPQGAGHNVKRGYACLRNSYILLAWISCSSHLHANDATAAVAQADYLRTANVLPGLSYNGKIIGVDMNRRSCEPGPAAYYYVYREADETSFSCSNTPASATTYHGNKIDYIWANPSGFNMVFGVTNKYPNESDHYTIWGTFSWT